MATTVFVVGAVVAAYVGFTAGWLRLPADGILVPTAGYVMECEVTHRRLLPETSSHGFAYRTLWLFVSLNALESHSLDLGYGWLFGYGGIMCRLTGLRSSAYLNNSLSACETRGIKQKLADLLENHGHDRLKLGDTWMFTMPSFLGFEGINPLTIYYCYDNQSRLILVVLEVHNTFGERHIYLLDKDASEKQVAKYTQPRLRWTISKEFHVSPFNNRQGSYVITVTEPSHPPTTEPGQPASHTPYPFPYVSIHLRSLPDSSTNSASDSLIMTATLRATASQPLTASNLLRYLVCQPFVLLSSLPRISYEAWILHYVKRLDVYSRPDPKPVRQPQGDKESATSSGDSAADTKQSGRGVGWQTASFIEKYACRLLQEFLAHRAEELDMRITLTSGNPDVPDLVFSPGSLLTDAVDEEELTISYLSPLFFSTILMAPSIEHALLLGCHTERTFSPSSEDLFLAVLTLIHQGHPQPCI